jgi:DNA-binding MarR family transcriptional regulator
MAMKRTYERAELADARAFMAIAEHPGATTRYLRKALGWRPSKADHVLSRLHDRGLVTRTAVERRWRRGGSRDGFARTVEYRWTIDRGEHRREEE